MAGNHKEWIEHGKNHPNIDHLNVTSPWDRLRDSHETKFGKNKIAKGKPFFNCQAQVQFGRRSGEGQEGQEGQIWT